MRRHILVFRTDAVEARPVNTLFGNVSFPDAQPIAVAYRGNCHYDALVPLDPRFPMRVSVSLLVPTTTSGSISPVP